MNHSTLGKYAVVSRQARDASGTICRLRLEVLNPHAARVAPAAWTMGDGWGSRELGYTSSR